MIRKPLSWNVKQVCTMIQKGSIIFDSPIQRPPGQWKDSDKSLLIHSALTMFVPDIYAIQEKTERGNTYSIIDGLQRLTNFSDFLANKWRLTDLPPVKLESTGETYNISGKLFSELPEEVQEEIKSFTLTFKAIEIEEGEDEEEIIEEIFYRLNNGKQVSREHLALVKSDSNVKKFVHRMITEHKLFTTIAHFAEGSVKKSDREMSVLQSIVLVSGKEFTSFAAKDIEAFFVQNDITDETLTATEQAFNTISEAFNEHNKFVSKINISAMANMFAQATDIDFASAKLLEYMESNKKGDKYRQYTGAGCTKKEVVTKRVKAMMDICKVTPKVTEQPKQQQEDDPELEQQTQSILNIVA